MAAGSGDGSGAYDWLLVVKVTGPPLQSPPVERKAGPRPWIEFGAVRICEGAACCASYCW
jgi:hypothetical protein